jgi:hypothetical protein
MEDQSYGTSLPKSAIQKIQAIQTTGEQISAVLS